VVPESRLTSKIEVTGCIIGTQKARQESPSTPLSQVQCSHALQQQAATALPQNDSLQNCAREDAVHLLEVKAAAQDVVTIESQRNIDDRHEGAGK